ncbi:hypothetical protein ABVT39_023269 [Epinephelus coioides]
MGSHDKALGFPAAEYHAAVWCLSPHVKKLNTALNTALRTICGCLRATPTNQLPVLAGITSAEVRQEAAMLALAQKAQMSESHLLHKMATETPQRSRFESTQELQHHLVTPRLPGARQDGGTNGSQQSHQDSTTTLKTPQMVPASTCPKSNGQPSIA